MGKKILVPCLDVIMIVFFYFSIRNMVFHCIFSVFFPITILFQENFTKKYPEKSSKIQTKCAHAPWAS